MLHKHGTRTGEGFRGTESGWSTCSPAPGSQWAGAIAYHFCGLAHAACRHHTIRHDMRLRAWDWLGSPHRKNECGLALIGDRTNQTAATRVPSTAWTSLRCPWVERARTPAVPQMHAREPLGSACQPAIWGQSVRLLTCYQRTTYSDSNRAGIRPNNAMRGGPGPRAGCPRTIRHGAVCPATAKTFPTCLGQTTTLIRQSRARTGFTIGPHVPQDADANSNNAPCSHRPVPEMTHRRGNGRYAGRRQRRGNAGNARQRAPPACPQPAPAPP